MEDTIDVIVGGNLIGNGILRLYRYHFKYGKKQASRPIGLDIAVIIRFSNTGMDSTAYCRGCKLKKGRQILPTFSI